jgi:hypothetical protein
MTKLYTAKEWEAVRDQMNAEVNELRAIAEIASQMDLELAADTGDVGRLCELEDKLTEALRPWRQRRMGQQQVAGFACDAKAKP